jgi:hypothetical protein
MQVDDDWWLGSGIYFGAVETPSLDPEDKPEE